MPRRISLEPHLSGAELYKKYLSSKKTCERDRYQVLWLLSQGKTTSQIAEVTRFHARGVRALVQRYNKGGPEAMLDRRSQGSGAPSRLNPAQLKALEAALEQDPVEGGRWNSIKVAAWIERETGVATKKQLGWVYLKRLDYALRIPRRRHKKGDLEAKDDFKKKTSPGS